MTLAETVLIPITEDTKALQDTAPEIEVLSKVNQREAEMETFKGLCVDCERRHHCVLSHTPGGVWNCNEYA